MPDTEPDYTPQPCCGAPADECDCELVAHSYHDTRHPTCRLCTRARADQARVANLFR